MFDIIKFVLVSLYLFSALALMIYGLNAYVMIFLYKKGSKRAEDKREVIYRKYNDPLKWEPPFVTTQVPVYNELNVVERVICAVCEMDYPKDRHEIQILDDSSDETSDLIDRVAEGLKKKGHFIKVIRRNNRTGYKAGALAHGLEQSEGEFVAVFDADFVPPKDYLKKTIPFFIEDCDLGLVQARWGHLNSQKSILTRVQSIGIDGHFMIEQSARNYSGLFMNFNGTAGTWRKSAIVDGGGWQWDTLTEDMDLSYRVQFKGWKTQFLPDLVVPAEIPEDISSFKSQQFRWAKGSMETAVKLFPYILHMDISFFKKVEAFFHLTHYAVHPLMLILSILALPVMTMLESVPGPYVFFFLAFVLLFSMSAPSTLYLVSQRAAYKNWFSRILFLPALVILGTGIALSNTRAVYEALAGKKSGFIRTPKKGDKLRKKYRVKIPVSAVFEIFLGVYCLISFAAYINYGKYLVGPFLAIYAAAFLITGLETIRNIRAQ